MKKSLKTTVALLLMLPLCFTLFASAAVDEDNKLFFNDDGKFTVVQFADCQDTAFVRKAMVDFIGKALDDIKPDLVVFTGDNVVQFGKMLNDIAIDQIVAPLRERGIPFAYTFGNHDAENGNKKENMHKAYLKYGNCLTYNADPSLTGYGNCCLPIFDADGEMRFNLWLFDSNMYDIKNGGYDYVHEDQIDWYKNTAAALAEENGGIVPALAFQHIPVPEIYEAVALKEEGTSLSTKTYNGIDYMLKLRGSLPGYLGEWPCPSNTNSGQLAAAVETGDIIGFVFGHDHVNDFIVNVSGIDLIQSPGITYNSYGDDAVRGFRVIAVDEDGSYETYTKKYTDYYGDSELKTLSWQIDIFGGFKKLMGYIFDSILNIFSVVNK
ncbi:MAG: metallophosphoesterase family protein [Oscillospiraceae bacterium]|nr:metallophosphoesterase family protein [Oscillospiraceae bacterium]